MPGPRPQMRPGGGFRPSFGDDFGEKSDDNAMQAAAQAKQLTQQAAATSGANPGSAKPGGLPAGMPGGLPPGAAPGGGQPQQPREVGSISEELVKRPAHDIFAGLKGFFDINNWLGINPQTDTPEQQATKQQLHSRWNKLTQDQQAIAQKQFQESMKKKQIAEQEAQRKRQIDAQKHTEIAAPSSPKKGPVGPASGSKKQKTTMKLQQDRKMLSQGQGAN